jgi:hypothetical protein
VNLPRAILRADFRASNGKTFCPSHFLTAPRRSARRQNLLPLSHRHATTIFLEPAETVRLRARAWPASEGSMGSQRVDTRMKYRAMAAYAFELSFPAAVQPSRASGVSATSTNVGLLRFVEMSGVGLRPLSEPRTKRLCPSALWSVWATRSGVVQGAVGSLLSTAPALSISAEPCRPCAHVGRERSLNERPACSEEPSRGARHGLRGGGRHDPPAERGNGVENLAF